MENRIVAELKKEREKLLSIVDAIDIVIASYDKHKIHINAPNPDFPHNINFEGQVLWLIKNIVKEDITPLKVKIEFHKASGVSIPVYRFQYILRGLFKKGIIDHNGQTTKKSTYTVKE